MTFENVLSVWEEPVNDDAVKHLLKPVGFSDYQAAHRCLKRLAQTPDLEAALAVALPQLLLTLSDAASPDGALINFERFIQNSLHPVRMLHDFAQNPRPLEILMLLFEGSQFLTEILLRHPHYFSRLTAHHQLAQPKSTPQLRREAHAKIAPLLSGQALTKADLPPLLNALRRFQRWELLRIGISDLLGIFDLSTVIAQLSYLADSLAQTALNLTVRQSGIDPENFVVIAMGKLGGAELNYSSDIDLLFLSLAHPNRYLPLGQTFIDILSRATAEGFLYRVDMRLRPWGRSGSLVSSLDSYLAYLQKHASLWEKQALLKARPIAGNQDLGQAFLQQIQPFLFTADRETIRAEVHSLKQRIEAKLKRQGQQWGEVKLGQGSIRDIEFVIQYLQLAEGGRQPNLRSANTFDALARLSAKKLITSEEYRVLVDGYTFLRTIEHHLQLMHYQQTHKLPTDPKALNHLAQRLGFRGTEAGANFIARYEQHSAVIRIIYRRYLDEQQPNDHKHQQSVLSNKNLLPHLTRMPPTYVTAFSERDIEAHAHLTEQLTSSKPIIVEAQPIKKELWQVTIVGYDDLGMLSLICGLMFVHGLNIIDGYIFSYGRPEHSPSEKTSAHQTHSRKRSSVKTILKPKYPRQKIVDVFTVRSINGSINAQVWTTYADELKRLAHKLREGHQHEAHGDLAKQAGNVLRESAGQAATLYPVDIEIDNEATERHTVLRINAPDTVGFLYEFTNALALNGINIRRMTVASTSNRVSDILYVTDAQGQKITDMEKQRELRAATVLIKQFTHLLPQSPNPETALLHFREFVGHLFTQPNWPDELTSLEQPEVLKTMVRLLGVSDFLWDDFLRMQHTNLFPVVQNVKALVRSKSKSDLRAELAVLLQAVTNTQTKRETLNAFKDREMFRIDMRQIQGHTKELEHFSIELSDLAEVVVEAAYHIAAREVRGTFGLPRLTNRHPCNLSLCALGKCGGRELGFASDIELMFIYTGNGRTSGPKVISNAEFFNRLVAEIEQIIKSRREGIFELDLRLRPYGKAGSLGVSLESFERYFAPDGPAWPYERQALIRLRPIAGDMKLGQEIIKRRDDVVYTGKFDVAAMRAMRERQTRHSVTAGTINAKLSQGGLVDVEYLVQGLQITHGQHNPSLRLTNTSAAMTALNAAGILPNDDYTPLREAHIFLRRLINALRMVRGNAKDLTVPPADSEEFAYLARRLNYPRDQFARLWDDLIRHTTNVQQINTRLLD